MTHRGRTKTEGGAVLDRNWEQLFQAIGQPAFIVDADCVTVAANRAAVEMLDRPVGEIVGRTCYEVLYSKTAPKESCPVVQALAAGGPVTVEREIEAMGVTLLVSCTPLPDESGRMDRFLYLTTDITDRKRTEAALRESEERLRDFFEKAAVGFHTFGPDRVITNINETELLMIGYDRDEIVGRKTWADLIVPEQKDRFDRHWRDLMATGQVRNLEYTLVHKDGHLLDVLLSATARFDEQGGLINTRGSILDITERKRAVEALAASEANYRTIFNAVNDGIFVHDADTGRFLDVNERGAQMLGRTPEDMRGMSLSDISSGSPPHTRAEAMRRVRKALSEPQLFEWRCKRSDGSLFWVEVNLKLAVIGGRTRILAIVRDIDERKLAEEHRRALEAQMQQAQKLESLGVLAGGIAHDFNNLLTAILGNADLAMMSMSASSPARENVEEIERASRRAAELCRQMLAYSGRGQFVIHPIDLSDVVGEMVSMLKVSISKKVLLTCNLADDLPAVNADAAQIRQVVMNLITNASEAIGDVSGTVTITTAVRHLGRQELSRACLGDRLPSGRYVCLEVADTGCGMDAETRARLFEPFFTTKFAGRGLGLAAVLGIVKSHEGAIRVDSTPGEGSSIQVILPGTEQQVAAEGAERAPGPPWRGSGTVLVVDDEEAVRNLARRMLEVIGLTVLTACNGREAVEIFGESADEIDCVLLDVTMPVMDGEETLRELQRLRPDVSVVLSSGYGEEEVAQRFAGRRLVGFVQKPYRLETLAAKMRDVLGE